MIQEWRTEALCAGLAPAFDSHVEGESNGERSNRIDAALATCSRCPVRQACKDDAVYGIDGGVRFGKVLNPIVPAAPRRKPPKTPIKEHGTTGGYIGHIRRGLQPCDPCKAAEAKRQAGYRKGAA